MIWLISLVCIVIFCFGFVLLFGAPYLPTLSPQVTAALKLAALQPGDSLLELGCGDGKVLIAAARQGIAVVGYELNPILFVIGWLRTRRYRRLVRIYCRDFWRTPWPPATAIFTFLLPKYMVKLDKKIAQYVVKQGQPVTLISFAFPVPDRPIDAETAGVLRYQYR